MITVVVYSHNDEKTIEWCLDSLIEKKDKIEHDVVVIDDGSTDRTVEIVRNKYPQVQLVQQNRTLGWIASIRDNLSMIKGDIVAFIGAHGRATENWLTTIDEMFTSGAEAVSGTATVQTYSYWDRFHAAVMPTYFSRGKFAESVWEDNFAVSAKILKSDGFLDTDIFISPGAAAIVLASRMKKKLKVPIYYEPKMLIDHELTTFRRLGYIWWLELPRNAITIRRAIPGITGTSLFWSGPVAAAAIAVGRYFESSIRMLRTRKQRGYALSSTLLHIFVLAFYMPIYFVGVAREIMFPIKLVDEK